MQLLLSWFVLVFYNDKWTCPSKEPLLRRNALRAEAMEPTFAYVDLISAGVVTSEKIRVCKGARIKSMVRSVYKK